MPMIDNPPLSVDLFGVQHPGLWSVGTALTSAWIVMWRTENIANIKYTINSVLL